ncbi:hypothetical protein [Blastococcus sp. SYSU DS0617]
MSETPEDRPRPTPRSRPAPAPRPTSGGRPSPRPRVAGSRREREEAAARAAASAEGTAASAPHATPPGATASAATGSTGRRSRPRRPAPERGGAARRRFPALLALLAVLCLAAAAGVGYLTWERLNPAYVDDEIFAAARSSVEDLYAYDYRDSEGSLDRKLAVLTGDLRETYEAEFSQGGILDTYEQVSATTSYEVLDVGLQQVNDAQDTATVVVFGRYLTKSVTSGNAPAPAGSECEVTPEGEQSCVQTIQMRMVEVDGDWKISELSQLTTS